MLVIPVFPRYSADLPSLTKLVQDTSSVPLTEQPCGIGCNAKLQRGSHVNVAAHTSSTAALRVAIAVAAGLRPLQGLLAHGRVGMCC